MIDLHLHTEKSDGTDTPLELLGKVEAFGCSVFSVTDHDNFEANDVIVSEMSSNQYTVRFITGAEISSVFKGRNLHLLCYGFDQSAESIKKMTDKAGKLRLDKVLALFDHLRKKHGIEISDKDRAEILSLDTPGKVHIAKAVLMQGIDMTLSELFDNCLNDMETQEFKLEAREVIDSVASAGGVVSFAHPIEVQKEFGIDFAETSAMIKKLADIGLRSVEVYHSSHGLREIEEYGKIANEYGLLTSGGSDYHGTNKENVAIGQLSSYGYTPTNDEITLCKQKG